MLLNTSLQGEKIKKMSTEEDGFAIPSSPVNPDLDHLDWASLVLFVIEKINNSWSGHIKWNYRRAGDSTEGILPKGWCKNATLPTTVHRLRLPRSLIECKEDPSAQPNLKYSWYCLVIGRHGHLTKGSWSQARKFFCTFVQTKCTRHEHFLPAR